MSALDMELNETQCKHNKMIDCNNHQCWNCGWNPAVAEKKNSALVAFSNPAQRCDDYGRTNVILIEELL